MKGYHIKMEGEEVNIFLNENTNRICSWNIKKCYIIFIIF